MNTTESPAPAHAASAALAQAVQAQYGHLLSIEQLEQMHQRLEEMLTMRSSLYRVALTNADEPALLFRAQPEAHHDR